MHSKHPSDGSTCGTIQRRACSRQLSELEDITTAPKGAWGPQSLAAPPDPNFSAKKKKIYIHIGPSINGGNSLAYPIFQILKSLHGLHSDFLLL